MDIHENIPLKNFTTMRLGGNARFMAEVHSIEDLQSVYQTARSYVMPVYIVGGGSNVVVHDEGYEGMVARIRILGFDIVRDELNTTTIKIGAGEDWDSVVKRIVEMRLSGVEAMSGIPGTTGATPVQNVGAYGQEIADTLESLEAYEIETGNVVILQKSDCGFSYRDSIFRNQMQGKYVIISVTLTLSKNTPQAPFYDALQNYLDAQGTSIYTQQVIRDAVLAIRGAKLPDPALLPNTGSFFKNAVVDAWLRNELLQTYPDMPSFDMGDDHFKIPTGWLIEKAGFKGMLLHGMRVHDKNCLVLINESATSYADLAAARDQIISTVRDIFRITIEQEPLEL